MGEKSPNRWLEVTFDLKGWPKSVQNAKYVKKNNIFEHSKAAQEGFERGVAAAPEVTECHNITGTIEYLLRVECRDLASYKVFHTDVLGQLPHVQSITTYVVMGSPKDTRA